MIYTLKIQRAIKFAIKTHEIYQKQKRKGKDVAYITHPLTAGLILALANAPEDVVVAGILHDTMEDCPECKQVTEEMLTERFGDHVAKLVLSVTETDKGASWEERKSVALEHIAHFSHDSLLLKSGDMLSNGTEIIADYARHGDKLFDHFSQPKEVMLQHQLKVIDAILTRWSENPLKDDLMALAKNLKEILIITY